VKSLDKDNEFPQVPSPLWNDAISSAIAAVQSGQDVENAARNAVGHMQEFARTDFGAFDSERAHQRVKDELNAYLLARKSESTKSEQLYRMVAPGRFALVEKEKAGGRLADHLTSRKIAVIVAAFAFVLAGLFPPWLHTYDGPAGHARSDAGYAFILSPPPLKGMPERYGVQLDTSRLLIEWVCVFAVSGTVWYLLGDARARRAEGRSESGHAGNRNKT
jgi:hypothetical protein